MSWPEVAVAAISACQVVALAALAIAMEKTKRESSKNHAETIQALQANGHDVVPDQQP